jgi:ferredoxin-nitrite reductase
VGVHPQRQPGLVYVGCSVPVGRLHGMDLVEAARLAEAYGDGTVRLGCDQNFTLSGVPEDRLDDLLAEPLLQAYSPFPGPFTRGVVACTGSEFCRFAVVETKERAVKWARALDAALAGEWDGTGGPGSGGGSDGGPGGGPGGGAVPGPGADAGVVRLHFSGCSASCAQPQVADIGFRGDIAHVDEHIEEAVDIGLGGSLGPDAAFLDWVAGSVPADRVPDALVRVLRRYRAEWRDGEAFHTWARRIPNDELRALLEGTAADGAALAPGEVGR